MNETVAGMTKSKFVSPTYYT